MLGRLGWRRHALSSARRFSSAAATTNNAAAARQCVAYRLGSVEYETAWDWQKQLIQQRIVAAREERPIANDVVLVLEHPSVYTLGRGATMANVRFDPQVDTQHKLIRVDRGGEVTYHGPGQVVVYPILDLHHYKKDLHWYLRQVEEVVIKTLAAFDIKGERVDGLTGVWVEEEKAAGNASSSAYERDMRKIAAVGTHATRWITMHGFAINTTTDLSAFDQIIPCGIDDRAVTSIERLKPNVTTKDVERAAIAAIQEVFGVDMKVVEAKSPL
ncbi:Lipoyl transferase, partial [Globisporangium splendens]